MKYIWIACLLLLTFMARADQTVTTGDGKQVLLKDNGTWQYIEQPELVAHFTGKGIKETDSFKITKKPWRLKWKAEGAAFGLSVKTEEGKLVTTASGLEDQSTIRQTGDFYLEIMAFNSYEIWILQ